MPSKVTLKQAQAGFSLLEMLVVIAIIGMLMALVGTNVFSQSDQAKVDISLVKMRTLQGAINNYNLGMSRVPSTQDGLMALVRKPIDATQAARWRGPYTDEDKLVDAWDRPFGYSAPGANGAPFVISSLGADGVAGGEGINADLFIPTSAAAANSASPVTTTATPNISTTPNTPTVTTPPSAPVAKP